MPSELRKIIFDKEEVRTAAVSYCLHAKVRMPQANIEDVIIDKDPNHMVTLKFSVNNPSDRSVIPLSSDQMGAAIIRYCKEQRIPLPKKGKKILRCEGDGLAMMVNVQYEPARTK